VSATALRRLVPVSDKEHATRSLLPGWKFLHAPKGAGPCWLCGRPAVYISAPPGGVPMCGKHSVDF
jgi:hypothetical protein